MAHPDTSLRHLHFQYHSILDANRALSPHGHTIHICHTEAQTFFEYCIQHFEIAHVYSYQESGIQLSYNRDLQVNKLLKSRGIVWKEFQRDGIRRGIHHRMHWDTQWLESMQSPIIHNTFDRHKALKHSFPFGMSADLEAKLLAPLPNMQPAGEMYAWKYLESFVHERGARYTANISRPLESRVSCSRLSPYLAWGNVSMKQVYQTTLAALQVVPHRAALQNFISRLHWHCHFIQKFEQECRYETECINRGYEALIYHENEIYLEAWMQGHTGIPLVDACMRCLHTTGWINFRMRALLVSYLCHHLFIDWRKGVYHLARLFLDYEPGIHYPQFQMQAGTTGINTIRIYNPIKNGQKYDPEGEFVKKWLPELGAFPKEYVHTPWLLPPLEAARIGFRLGVDYPFPVLSPDVSLKSQKDQLWGMRKTTLVRSENERIVKTHTRHRMQ